MAPRALKDWKGVVLKLQTKYFGLIDCEEKEAIQFPDGIPGFQEEKRFMLLPFADSNNTMLCLQSVETPMLAFVLLDPFSLLPDYQPDLQREDLERFEVQSGEQLYFYVLCTMRTPISSSTVNLRCPIAINPNTLVAHQVFLDADKYEMRHLLSSFENDGGKPC